MADHFNISASVLSVGGKDYAPGEKIPLTAEQLKDATVDWWIRSGFVSDNPEGAAVTAAFIPTFEESAPPAQPGPATKAKA